MDAIEIVRRACRTKKQEDAFDLLFRENGSLKKINHRCNYYHDMCSSCNEENNRPLGRPRTRSAHRVTIRLDESLYRHIADSGNMSQVINDALHAFFGID